VKKPQFPKSFKLTNGKKFKVTVLDSHHHTAFVVIEREGRVFLARSNSITKVRYSPSNMTVAFWHETVHAILDALGKHRLNKDEVFVEGMARNIAKVLNPRIRLPR
jgi:hypothetical protein